MAKEIHDGGWKDLVGYVVEEVFEANAMMYVVLLMHEKTGSRLMLLERSYRSGLWHLLFEPTDEEIEIAKRSPWTIWNGR